MKKIFSFLLCLVLLFASLSCGKKDSGLPDEKNNFENGNAANDTDAVFGGVIEDMPNPLDLQDEFVLELAAFKDIPLNKALNLNLELFKEKNPNVTVNVRLFDDAVSYAKELKELILSGEYVPDLFLAPVSDEFLDDGLVQSKLCDIYDLMYEDLRFIESDWFMQLIDAFARDGKLYEFPVNVMPVLFGVSGSLPDNVTESFTMRSRINLHEMIELFKQNEASGLSFFSGQKNSEYYIRYAPGDFADAETDLINITTPMFINFADFFIEMSSTELTGSMHENMLDSNFEREKEKSGLYMFNRTSYAEWYYILPSSAPEPGFAGMVPLADSGGRILLDKQTYSMRFSVCAESKNQEAAWELIKFFASPAFYEDEKRIMTSDAYEYWFYSRDCYMPVYKPALKTKIISALKNVTGQFVYISFAFDTKITDADHADFMMDFYERLFQYEFVYRAEDWQSLAMFDAYAYYLSHTKNYRESDVPFSDVAEQVQRSYEKLMQNDPEHFWIEEQLTGENQPGGSYTFKRYIILLIELQKMFIRYGFPE